MDLYTCFLFLISLTIGETQKVPAPCRFRTRTHDKHVYLSGMAVNFSKIKINLEKYEEFRAMLHSSSTLCALFSLVLSRFPEVIDARFALPVHLCGMNENDENR